MMKAGSPETVGKSKIKQINTETYAVKVDREGNIINVVREQDQARVARFPHSPIH